MSEIILIIKIINHQSLETSFDESFKVTSAPFFIPDFNLLSCELKQNKIVGRAVANSYDDIPNISQFLVKNLKSFPLLLQ